jgi:adenosylcobinamide kinase/adenosylcobinamide-phosphate guanylyltransferase
VLEVPLALTATVQSAAAESCLLVDSLGTWTANCLELEEATWTQQVQDLLQALQTVQCSVILVAEETGWGVVPAFALGRSFRDRLGNLTRQVGAIADTVYLVTGGYVLNLSQLGTPLT